MTKSKFCSEDPKILGTMVQNVGHLAYEICAPQSYGLLKSSKMEPGICKLNREKKREHLNRM
jgi:hypothetical protein